MQCATRFSNSATSQNLNQSQMIALLSLPSAEMKCGEGRRQKGLSNLINLNAEAQAKHRFGKFARTGFDKMILRRRQIKRNRAHNPPTIEHRLGGIETGFKGHFYNRHRKFDFLREGFRKEW